MIPWIEVPAGDNPYLTAAMRCFSYVFVLVVAACCALGAADTGVGSVGPTAPGAVLDGDCVERDELKRMQFAYLMELYEKGEYAQTGFEITRFLSYFPDDSLALELLYLKALAGYRSSEYQDAIRCFNLYLNLAGQKADKAQFMVARSHFRLAAYVESSYEFAKYLEITTDSVLAQKATAYLILSALENYEWTQADTLMQRYVMTYPASQYAPGLVRGIETNKKRRVYAKSPVFAGMMSAVFPGSGQLYCRRPRDAIFSLSLNAAFMYATYHTIFRSKNYAAAYLLSGLTLSFYVGNIYGAARMGRNSLRDSRQKHLRRMIATTGLGSFY